MLYCSNFLKIITHPREFYYNFEESDTHLFTISKESKNNISNTEVNMS